MQPDKLSPCASPPSPNPQTPYIVSNIEKQNLGLTSKQTVHDRTTKGYVTEFLNDHHTDRMSHLSKYVELLDFVSLEVNLSLHAKGNV